MAATKVLIGKSKLTVPLLSLPLLINQSYPAVSSTAQLFQACSWLRLQVVQALEGLTSA